MTDLPDYEPEALPEPANADRFPETHPQTLHDRLQQSRFIDELLHLIRQANEPRPIVILEREQADFLRHLLLDLIAGNEPARYALDRLRIALDLLDGRTRQNF